MKLNTAKDLDFELGWIGGGVRFYPYQFGMGVSVSFWPCLKRPQVAVHIGPFKIWLGISGQRVYDFVRDLTRKVQP